MRIVHVDTAHEWRGGQNQILLTAQGLIARGHDVTLVCREGGVLAGRASAAGLDVRAMVFRGDLSPAALFPLARVLRETRADVLQLNDPHAVGCGLLAARLARRRVWTVGTRRVDFHLHSRLSRFKYAACDRVIAVSRAIHSILEQDRLDGGRLRLVYEGVADRKPEQGGHAVLASLGIPEGSPVVGNVAALTEHKDQKTLLEAAALVVARVPEARFLVVGEGELRAALEARARELGLGDRCVFAGFRTDLDRLIPAFTVFCFSSKWEGLGTSLLDAMCFARPIVATAAGGIPEAVVDGDTGRLVPVRDPQALADALVDVLSDKTRRDDMGCAGRRRFLERFTAERMVDETLAVYTEGR